MMRKVLSLCAPAIAAVLASAATGHAQDAAMWSSTQYTIRVSTATFAVPESDDIRFTMECRDARTITIDPYVILDSPPAATPALRFTVDGREFVRGATVGARSEMLSGFPLVAVVDRSDDLIEALRTGNAVEAAVHPASIRDLSARVTLTGSADAINAMLDNC